MRKKQLNTKSPKQRKKITSKSQAIARPLLKLKPETPLKNDDFTNGALCITSFSPKLEYEWDTGNAMGHYLDGLKNGVLLGRLCKNCNRILIPPRMFCELCFRPTSEWIPLQDIGTVNTFSLCYITWNMTKLSEPQIPAVIEIDGASKGMGILHLIGEAEPRRVRPGLRVKAIWKPPEERQGAITDIKYFKPL